MSVQTADHSTVAMQASAEGQMALVTGDVVLAKAKYAEAGDYLRRDIARLRKAPEKHLQQFLAATQYYKGGHYQRAYDMAKRIEARFLTDHVGELLSQFLKDAKARSSSDYVSRLRTSIGKFLAAEKYLEVLDLLREHPYVLESADFSYWRAVACEQLGNFRAAALCYAAARRYATSEISLLLQTITCPLRLPSQGRLDEAWEYSQHLIELLPHPITFITASIICYRRISVVSLGQRDVVMEQQVRYIEHAWDGYQQLSQSDQEHFDVKPYMAFGLVGATHTWLELGKLDRAKEMSNVAIEIAPNTPNPWTMRGVVTHPAAESVADFKKAITFPEAGYIPYAMLATDAWERRDVQASLSYCQQALAQKPEGESEGKLYGWIAACHAVLGSPRTDVVALFKKSIKLAPGQSEATRNYQVYLDHTTKADRSQNHTDQTDKIDLQEFVWQNESRSSQARATARVVDHYSLHA